MLLLEQIVTIGLVGMLLLMVAAATIQTGRGGKSGRLDYEASNVAQNLLETYQARSVSLLPLGRQPAISGRLPGGTDYTAIVELLSEGGAGIAAGLTDNDIKRIRVSVAWMDTTGLHTKQAEGVLVRIAR